jgi:hypothetical protein
MMKIEATNRKPSHFIQHLYSRVRECSLIGDYLAFGEKHEIFLLLFQWSHEMTATLVGALIMTCRHKVSLLSTDA